MHVSMWMPRVYLLFLNTGAERECRKGSGKERGKEKKDAKSIFCSV